MACMTALRSLQQCRKSLLQTITRRSGARQASNAPKEKIEYTPPKGTWVSYGFSRVSEEIDRHSLHQTFFVSITICVMFGGFLLVYSPDPNLRDWAQREAYLQLRRREELGLPPIDPNFIDPARIKLPSDEELGDFKVII